MIGNTGLVLLSLDKYYIFSVEEISIGNYLVRKFGWTTTTSFKMDRDFLCGNYQFSEEFNG